MRLQQSIQVQANGALIAGGLSEAQLRQLRAGKSFLLHFALMTVGLVWLAYFAYSTTDWAHTNAMWFGIALCFSTSLVSFLLTEWAYHQPTGVFLMVAMGSVVVRLFNLAVAFGLGQFFLSFPPLALAASLLTSYFSYLVIEIVYIHRKALIDGQ